MYEFQFKSVFLQNLEKMAVQILLNVISGLHNRRQYDNVLDNMSRKPLFK